MINSRTRKSIEKIAENPDDISSTEFYFLNKDMLKLIKLTKTTSKKDAIYSAIKFTIEKLEENKLEQMRYKREESHDAANDLLDTDIANRKYQGKFTC